MASRVLGASRKRGSTMLLVLNRCDPNSVKVPSRQSHSRIALLETSSNGLSVPITEGASFTSGSTSPNSSFGTTGAKCQPRHFRPFLALELVENLPSTSRFAGQKILTTIYWALLSQPE